VVCPMAYTTDPAAFRAQIAGVMQLAGSRPVWAGIGAYRLSAAEAVENIQAARRLGAEGVVLFSYDSLTPQANANKQYLADVGQGAFGQP
jgi:dihydrodipicolinate synthase/N-acetylneuraminate lyase